MASHSVDVARKMILGFQQPYDEEGLKKYMSLFAEDVYWYDHPFRNCRVGRQAVAGLRTSWLHCNQPFDAKIKSIEATPSSVTAEVIYVGRTANDIVRPDGQVAVKATGRDYVCHVCILFKVNANGEITRVDEYYNKQWDDGVEEGKYHVIKGASLRDEKI